MVQLPVLVEGKNGKPLPADQATLSLTEDGATQQILSLAPALSQPLTFGLLVDTSSGQHASTAEIKAAAAGFVKALMGQPQTKGFIVHFDHEVELLQDLTPNTAKLLTAVSLLDSPEPVGGDVPDPHAQAMLYDAIYLSSSEIAGKQPGRRVLVLFSGGMDQGSKESLRDAIDTAQKNNTLIYAVYVKSESQKHAQNSGDQPQPERQRRSGTGLPFPGSGYPGSNYPGSNYPGSGYPGSSNGPGGNYPSGNRQPGHPEAPKGDAKRVLADIATPTGGRVFELSKKQDAATIFAMIQDDIAHRAVLTFNPDQRGARPGFHSIRVFTTQKDARIDAPDGFYVKEPD